jgi:hypothetical protein
MTLHEFGAWVKRKSGKYKNDPDTYVAIRFLKDHPQYADLLDSTPDKIRQLLKNHGFFSKSWEDKAKDAESIHKIQLAIDAAEVGVDIPTLMQMKLNDQQGRMTAAHMVLEQKLKVEMMVKEAAHNARVARLEARIERMRQRLLGGPQHAPNQRGNVPKARRKAKRKMAQANYDAERQSALTGELLDQIPTGKRTR